MNMLNKEIKINRNYVMLFIIFNFILLAIYYTYGIITVKQLKDDISLINVSSNIVTMSSSDLTNNSITVLASTSQDITISLNNSAITTQYYRIIHSKVPTGVAVYEKTNDDSSWGSIEGSAVKISSITINNTTSADITVTFICQDSGASKFDIEMGYSYVNNQMNFDHSGVKIDNNDFESAMIPVYYEASDATTGVWKKADVNNNDSRYIWYDYDNFMWANAVTVSNEKRDQYKNADLGTEINLSDINAFFVYIPKYKYYIVSGNGSTSLERQIRVAFLSNNRSDIETNGSVNCHDSISTNLDEHLYSEICSDSVYGNIYNNLSTYVHPAEDFWIGKFSSSDSSTIQIKPNSSLSSITEFTSSNIRKMTGYNNPYGFSQSSSATYNESTWLYSNNTASVSTTPINSMEWGAVAILTSSQYGKSGNPMYSTSTIKSFSRVYNNMSYIYTGRSTNYTTSSTSVVNSSSTFIGYNDLTNVTHTSNGITYPIGYRGAGASTTGTIYGVYDMSGGQYKNVMGVFMKADGTSPYSMDSSFYTQYSYVPYEGKLKDYTNAAYLEVFKLGDGIKEHVRNYSPNGMWQDGSLSFVHSGSMRRGGFYTENGSLFTVVSVSQTSLVSTYVVLRMVSIPT